MAPDPVVINGTNKGTRTVQSSVWDGRTSKAMLKESIIRRVVTVHHGEEFHFPGRNQAFPWKDVNNSHVESSEVCRDPGAAIVYRTKRMYSTHVRHCNEEQPQFVMQLDRFNDPP